MILHNYHKATGQAFCSDVTRSPTDSADCLAFISIYCHWPCTSTSSRAINICDSSSCFYPGLGTFSVFFLLLTKDTVLYSRWLTTDPAWNRLHSHSASYGARSRGHALDVGNQISCSLWFAPIERVQPLYLSSIAPQSNFNESNSVVKLNGWARVDYNKGWYRDTV